MTNRIQVKRGSEVNLPVLSSGELGFTTDSNKLFIGDGVANHRLAMYDDIYTNEIIQDAIGSILDTTGAYGDIKFIYDDANGYIAGIVENDSHSHIIGNVDGLQTALDSKSNTGHSHTETDIIDFGNYSSIGHTHDSRYYTENEIDSLLSYKASSTHTHTESDITDLHTRYTDPEAVNAINLDSDHGSTAQHNYFSGDYNDLNNKPSIAYSSPIPADAFTSTEVNNLRAGKLDNGTEPWTDNNYYNNENAQDAIGGILDTTGAYGDIIFIYDDTNGYIAATVQDDSHNHVIGNIDNLQNTLNNKSNTGHSHTQSDITDLHSRYTDAEAVSAVEATHLAMNNHNITGINELSINDPGEGIRWKGGSSGDFIAEIIDDSTDNIFDMSANHSNNWTVQMRNAGTGSIVLDVDGIIRQAGNDIATKSWVNNYADVPNADYADSAGNANTLDGNNAASFATAVHSHTENEIIDLGNYSVIGHTHDSRYYTESEVDSLLSGKSNTGHTHTYLSNSGGTLDGGVDTTLTLKSDDSGRSQINLYGDSQGTGRVYVGQSGSYGGGIEYNGDNSPTTTGAGSDFITLYRRSSGSEYWTARNRHSNNDWEFRGNILVGGTVDGVDIANLDTIVSNHRADNSAHHTRYTDEEARDAIGTALTAGSNVSINVDDAGNTITISSTDTNTQLSASQVQSYINGDGDHGSTAPHNYYTNSDAQSAVDGYSFSHVGFQNKEAGTYTVDGDLFFDHSEGLFVYRTYDTVANASGVNNAALILDASNIKAGNGINIIGGIGQDSGPVQFSIIEADIQYSNISGAPNVQYTSAIPADDFTSTEVSNLRAGKLDNGTTPWTGNIPKHQAVTGNLLEANSSGGVTDSGKSVSDFAISNHTHSYDNYGSWKLYAGASTENIGSGNTVQISGMGDILVNQSGKDIYIEGYNTWRGIDDSPVNGQTSQSISSNWAYDHTNYDNAHHTRYSDSEARGAFEYLNVAANTINIGTSATTLTWNTAAIMYQDPVFAVGSAAPGVITVNTNGKYLIQVEVSTRHASSSTTRTTTRAFLTLNGGEVSDSRCFMYNRTDGYDVNSGSITYILNMTTSDWLEVRADVIAGYSTMEIMGVGTRLTIQRIG